ncbi:MAG: hypothetical protein JSS02_17850 [Planctomycetes bacterium]|nr:hypothetical protein [Planctomycetota bacterium]
MKIAQKVKVSNRISFLCAVSPSSETGNHSEIDGGGAHWGALMAKQKTDHPPVSEGGQLGLRCRVADAP